MPVDRAPFEAVRYDDGTVSYPPHPVGRNGGQPVDRIDLTEREGTIVTWTTSTATPPGVREPNHLAIVEFELETGDSVRAIGQLTTGDVAVGDRVRPVYAEELRDPEQCIRVADSQRWDGYRFEPC